MNIKSTEFPAELAGVWVDELDKIRQCARPVIFLTDIGEYSFSIGGTAFLVGFGDNVFIITAKHVVQSYPPEKLVVFSSDKSKKHIQISNWWNIRMHYIIT